MSPLAGLSTAPGRRSCLIATLGSEPQVVTLCLQALAAAREPIDEIATVHPGEAAGRMADAVQTLDNAFAHDERLAAWRERYRRVVIAGEGGPVPDLLEAEDFRATLGTLYRLVRDYKQAGYRIHLNLSGGRKLMALCGATVAQLLFDEDDRLWYLQSAPELVASRALFARDSLQVRLVAIPLLRWSPAPPILTDLALAEDPVAALNWQQARLTAARRRFLAEELTPAERAVVELAVRSGATDAELARTLHKSPRTVSHQLAVVYEKLRAFLGVRDDVRIDRRTLMAQFAGLMGAAIELSQGPDVADEK